jgi:hypothetical protein
MRGQRQHEERQQPTVERLLVFGQHDMAERLM